VKRYNPSTRPRQLFKKGENIMEIERNSFIFRTEENSNSSNFQTLDWYMVLLLLLFIETPLRDEKEDEELKRYAELLQRYK
jgi:hypothetical protein